MRTSLEFFRRELLETGGYRTAPEHRAAKRRRPGALATVAFSVSISRVYPLCALYEALHALSAERFCGFCFSAVTKPEQYGMNLFLEGFGERRDCKGPVVYVCNHMSTYETVLLPPTLITFGPLKLVTKASLAHLPCLERAAQHMGVVPLGRTDPRADLMKLYDVGCAELAAGASFLIFPQGTRQEVFARNHFSSIGAKLAEKAGVPLVPIAVDSRCQTTRKGSRLFKDFGPLDTARDIRCACGPVIPCGKSREMHEKSFDWIASKLESWGLPTSRER